MKARHEFIKYYKGLHKDEYEAYKEYVKLEIASRAMQGILAGGANIHDVQNNIKQSGQYTDALIKELNI